MKSIMKLIYSAPLWGILGLVIFVLLLPACKTGQKLYTIGIVQITDDPALNEAREGVLASLKEAGYEEGKNIKILYKNAQGEIPNINLILNSFKSDKVDMVITNGTPCMAGAAHIIKDIPVVFTVSFSPGQIGITEAPKNLTGVYDPLVLQDFLGMIKGVNPAIKKIGIIYNAAEPNAQFGANNLKKECIKENIELAEVTINSSNEVLQAAEALALKKVEAIAIAADNTAYMGFESIVKISLRNKIPVYVTEPSQAVRGALGGLGIDFSTWGRESGKLAARIIKGEKMAGLPILALEQKSMVLNKKIAGQLNITFSNELLAKASRILE